MLLPAGGMPARAGDWIDFRHSDRYLVQSEFPIDSHPGLSRFLNEPEAHEADIRATLGLEPSRQLIVIYLFASRRAFLQEIRDVAPEATGRRAVFVKGESSGQVYCYRHADLLTDLRHELTHAVLHSMLPFLPLWLDEGLAEYFETPRAERASGHQHQKQVVLSSKIGLIWYPSLRKLEARDDLSEIRLRHYREAWAWVHFLLHGPPNEKQLLQRYLAAIQALELPGPLSHHLQRTVAHPEAALTAHFRSWK